MTAQRRHRGEPLIMLGALMCGWVGLRAALWEPPYQQADASGYGAGGRDESIARKMAHGAAHPVRARPAVWFGGPAASRSPLSGAEAGPLIMREGLALPADLGPRPVAEPRFTPPQSAAPEHQAHPASLAAAHQLMWMAAVNAIPASWLDGQGTAPKTPETFAPPDALGPRQREILGARFPASAPASGGAPASNGARHWSGDGWMLVRGGSDTSTSGAALPIYGASQLGAVLRYRLAPSSGHQFSVYARATSALGNEPGQIRDKDAALGVSARPLSGVPIMLAAEARVSQFADGSTHLRPAIMGVSQVPPMALPLGLRADLYAAGGYVGGAAATGFAEGQLHVDHHLLALGPVQLRLGAGAWGGAQQGASRWIGVFVWRGTRRRPLVRR